MNDLCNCSEIFAKHAASKNPGIKYNTNNFNGFINMENAVSINLFEIKQYKLNSGLDQIMTLYHIKQSQPKSMGREIVQYSASFLLQLIGNF